MPDCARCGRSDPDRKLYPPREWVEYLQVERDLPPPEGSLAVPLCGDCRDRLSVLRGSFREIADLDAEAREATRDRIREELDGLDPAALLDETGPDHDDARSLF